MFNKKIISPQEKGQLIYFLLKSRMRGRDASAILPINLPQMSVKERVTFLKTISNLANEDELNLVALKDEELSPDEKKDVVSVLKHNSDVFVRKELSKKSEKCLGRIYIQLRADTDSLADTASYVSYLSKVQAFSHTFSKLSFIRATRPSLSVHRLGFSPSFSLNAVSLIASRLSIITQ